MLKRVVSPGEMTETFQNRSDFLCYRHTVFSRNVQFSENKNAEPNIYLQKVNGKSGYALSEGKRGYRISTYITNETGGQTGSSSLIIFCLGDYFVKFPDLSPVTAFMFVQNQKRSWSVSTGIGPNWPMKTWLSECSTRVKGVWRLPSTSRGTGSSRQRWSTSNLQGRGRWLNHRYTLPFLWMTFF